MSAPRPFAELLSGVIAGTVSISELVNELNARGAVQGPLHKAELGQLDAALAEGKLDEKLHRLMAAKLKELQLAAVTTRTRAPAAKTPSAPDADKTVMGGGGDKTTLNPAGPVEGDKTMLGDRTRINPAGPADDKTALNPNGGNGGFDLLVSEQDDGEKTQMGEPRGDNTGGYRSTTHTGSNTGSSTSGPGGPSTSTWARMANTGGPDREVHAGDTLKDRFYLEKEVGRGGMGIVFKASDERKVEAQDKNPWVAVKVLNPEFRKHPQALVALQRESRKAQQLTHDNILRVYDFDKDGTIIYMTMEYVDGGSLKDVIKKHPQGMPFAKGWPIIEGLARGLARAHRDNIVHSDFKPGNVMMTSDLVPKLFDLGIARAAKSGGSSTGETTVFDAGELGALTPAYASLEMIQGQAPELTDDIYALGITAYEILTGKHPFGKKNAEEVLKQGLKPPVVPGLTRRQRRTLEASVGLKRADRCKSAEEFIHGLRPRSLQERFLPVGIAASLIALIAVAALGPGRNYLREQRIDALVARYQAGQFANLEEATKAFTSLNDAEMVLARQKGVEIQDYFFRVANSHWDKEKGLYDYPAAMAALGTAATLFPDSARVAQNIQKLDEQKKDEILRLNEEKKVRVAAGALYEDKTPNVVQTLTLVRKIDPRSLLLNDAALAQRYTSDVKSAWELNNYELAAARVATARKAFPNDPQLATLEGTVRQGREMQLAAAREREMREKMSAADAKVELLKLAANPTFAADWQVAVKVAMSKLGTDTSPETQQAKAQLADAYGKQLADKLAANDLMGGQALSDAALKMFPGAPNLTQQAAKLAEARKAQQAEEAAKLAASQVNQLKSDVLLKADANDVRGAGSALDQLRKLTPADPFVLGEGAKAVGLAYLRQANKQAEQKQFANALRFASEGLKVSPASQELKQAEAKYKEAEAAQRATAAANPAPAPPTEVASASATPPPGSSAGLAQESRRAQRRVAPGQDPCSTSFAGYGSSARATCADEWEAGKGPKLVVIQTASGGYLAVGKYEVRNSEFDAFCKATGKCRAGGGENMPRTGVSLSLARAYADWLSEQTGRRYRLPTDEEWAYAANAGGKGTGEDFQCIVLAGGSQIRGGAAVSVTTGKPNPWGLLNAVGNVAELTEGGSARGAHFNTPTSQCAVEWRQGAGESDTVGFRLVREMG